MGKSKYFRSTYAAVMGVVLAFALAACSTLGQQPAKSPEDTLRYGQATLTGVYKAITQNNVAKTITLAQADSATAKADKAKTILAAADTAIKAPGGFDTATVQGKLSEALAILEPLLAELQATLPKPKVEAWPDEGYVPNIAAVGLLVTVEALNYLINGIISLLGLFGSTKKVSDIIAARISAGRTSWTDDERKAITDDLDAAQAETHASLEARRAAEGGGS